MDKQENIYRQHSAKEHLVLALMIILAFFILTSQYNPEVLPSLTETPTGAAAAGIGLGSVAVWSIIMLLLIIGIIIGIIMWWKNHRKIQVQRALQQDVDGIINAAGKSSKPVSADPLTRKLIKVQQELVDIPLRSATKGHIIKAISSEYQKTPERSARSLRHFLPRKKPTKVIPPHKVRHRPSLDEKMVKIKKEINRIKMK